MPRPLGAGGLDGDEAAGIRLKVDEGSEAVALPPIGEEAQSRDEASKLRFAPGAVPSMLMLDRPQRRLRKLQHDRAPVGMRLVPLAPFSRRIAVDLGRPHFSRHILDQLLAIVGAAYAAAAHLLPTSQNGG